MTIALIGATGQLGSVLAARWQPDVVCVDRTRLDITDRQQVHSVLESLQPDIVVNAAAYNQVDQAEQHPLTACKINALGPRYLAEYCAQQDVRLVHFSSDYVFGYDELRHIPYTEEDRPGPLSAYGTSKLAGENFVQGMCPRHFVLRTCGLYGQASNPERNNFVKTMLRLAKQGQPIRVVDDQLCTPTSVESLADAVCRLLETDQYGLYHATNTGQVTWRDFAQAIFEWMHIPIEIVSITSAEFGAQAKRPSYSVLDCGKLARVIGGPLPNWELALQHHLGCATS
jgi:dTDP-4-dehydrorhamnose reductase